MTLALSLVLTMAWVGNAGAQEKASTANVKSVIEATNAKFATALKAGNAAEVAALYTEDAVVMAPGAPALTGKAAIAEMFGGWLASTNVTDFTLTATEVVQAGEYAFETGAYNMIMQPKSGGDVITDKGKYIVVWKREGGVWKLHRDAWNSDAEH
jgi:uncharacterized protein (TIGR02246 family)